MTTSSTKRCVSYARCQHLLHTCNIAVDAVAKGANADVLENGNALDAGKSIGTHCTNCLLYGLPRIPKRCHQSLMR